MKNRTWKRLSMALVMATAVVSSALAQSKSAEEMLTEINGVKNPTITREQAQDPALVKDFQDKLAVSNRTRAELILAFAKAYPTHDETPKLLTRRWTTLRPMRYPLPKEDANAIRNDIDAVLASVSGEEVAKAGKFVRSQVSMFEAYPNAAPMLSAAEEFVAAYPKDERGARLLQMVADQYQEADKRLALYERIVKDYEGMPSAKYVKGKVRQAKSLNQPFELKFTDAISGKQVTMADFKGKVVVIDFWATWCGPCIAELPKMQKMYEDYKDKGLEIISVSLDQPEDKGGLTSLRNFVAKNKMPWAHYYQGNFWDSEFSVSWGINAIPALFLVDQKGNLVDIEARQGIENRVKALLEKG